MAYCSNLFSYQRRQTREVRIGSVGVGGNNPIRVQSMTISDTLNTDEVVKEAKGLIDAGCEIVRITAPTIHHAENLKNIRNKLRSMGIKTPLVADIHFTPQAAMIAADYVEKVRINPGNFADRKLFAVREYTDSEYEKELERLGEKFIPLVRKCRERGVALRIGTNHGSLSDRILNRYGDTPLGMVESALEFLRICESEKYFDLVLSMKASNPQVMVQAYRLLVDRMNQENMYYPLHLGVTEAGEGEDGRIKSAIGILSLLEDGIGDTIRVSLTEDSIHEIPVAQAMVEKYNSFFLCKKVTPQKKERSDPPENSDLSASDFLAISSFSAAEDIWSPFHYTRRLSETLKLGPQFVGSKHVIRVQVSRDWSEDVVLQKKWEDEIAQLLTQELFPEIVSFRWKETDDPEAVDTFINYAEKFKEKFSALALGIDLKDVAFLFPQFAPVVHKVSLSPSREKNHEGYLAQAIEIIRIAKQLPVGLEWKLSEDLLPDFAKESEEASFPSSVTNLLAALAEASSREGLERFGLCWAGSNFISTYRQLACVLNQKKIEAVLHLAPQTPSSNADRRLLQASGDLGSLLLDGLGDSLETQEPSLIDSVRLSYNILQGARQRISKTEFIACPSCGRTLFDLQTTTARIKKITSHLKGVKIAIMGCIVNGPGEMADADFGYVGGGPDRIHLYVGKTCVEKNIPQEQADQRLVELIKSHGRWVEPPNL